MTGDTRAAVQMATSGKVRVFGLRQTDRALGHFRTLVDPEPRAAVLQEVASDRHYIRQIDRRFVINLDSDNFYSDLGSWDTLQVSVELSLDANSEIRILDLNVRNDGTCIWASDDVNARQAHGLSEKCKHICREICGAALRHVARNMDRAVVRGMLEAQNSCSRSEVDECSCEDAGLHLVR